MRQVLACAAVLGLSLAAAGGALAGEDDGADDEGRGARAVVRARHDVSCGLRLPSGVPAQSGSTVSAKFVVRNRGRRNEPFVTLSVFADAPAGTPLWTETISLRAHRRRTRHLLIDVPPGTTWLVAVAACDGDDNPGNNIDGFPVGGGTLPAPAPAPAPAVDPAILAGAATYATNCASCHGVAAAGTRDGPRIVGKSAHDLLEAMRKGEEEMPSFPGLTWTDAQNLAAFLKDPAAATPPAAPPAPPPAGQSPTYAGQIRSILDTSCVVCHTGAGAPKGIRLETYARASADAATSLSAMQGNRMPPGSPLPSATVQLFADWIAGGKRQ